MPARTSTADSSDVPSTTSPLGRIRSRLPTRGRYVFDLISDTVDAAATHELDLFAPALAFSLVVSLAPLTLALRHVGLNLADVGGALPSDPLADIAVGQVVGDYGIVGPVSAIIAGGMLVWGGSRMFILLADAIHRIWEEPGHEHAGLRGFIRRRGLAVLLLFAVAGALFASAILGSVVSAAAGAVSGAGAELGVDLDWLQSLASSRVLIDFFIATLFCLSAFTAVPDGDQKLRNIVTGVLITAAAYAFGQLLLGRYLSSNPRLDALGLFGSFVAFLLWAYYTAMIVLWGAELTYQISRRLASKAAE